MFLAEQLETNHPVAVKVLSSRFRHDREEIKRFQTGEKAYRGWELTLDEMLPSKAEIEAKISPACKCTSRLFPRLVPRR